MKRKTAKELLADSFQELAEKKAVDTITIQEIVDNCGYSPATFYRQFKDKYDLIAWNYMRQISDIMERTDRKGRTWKRMVEEGFVYFSSQREYLINLLQHTSGYDAFILYMANAHIDMLTGAILKETGEKALSEDQKVYVKIYCYGITFLVCEWLMGDMPADPARLADIFVKAMPEPLTHLVRLE